MNLTEQRCVPSNASTPVLSRDDCKGLLNQVENWQLNNEATVISREFRFKNYYETMAFVNALAWLAHQEDHHPDIEVSYNRCFVHFKTHSVNGLTKNDFICAAKTNRILQQ